MKIIIENLFLKQNAFSLNIKNWTLPPNSHVLIEGASGSGKTSFLHLLAGFLKPTSGHILLNEKKIDELSAVDLCRFRRAYVGMIFQKIHLLPHLTLFENVLLGAKNLDQTAEIPALLKKLGLENRFEHLPSQLSLGETQRASVARALISKPEIIFADEPTASLDDQNAEIVFQLLIEQCKGKSLLVVTHDARARSFFEKSVNFKELLGT